MIDRQKGDNIVIECDSCPATFDAVHEGLGIGSSNFSIVWGAAKDEGWRARKIGQDWVHGCPKCGA